MKYLFEDWKSVQDRIQRAQNLFLFLDYDGTLTPLVSSPELALCPREVMAKVGEDAREYVRRNFLITRHLGYRSFDYADSSKLCLVKTGFLQIHSPTSANL
jgi:hypothetical protein